MSRRDESLELGNQDSQESVMLSPYELILLKLEKSPLTVFQKELENEIKTPPGVNL